MCKISLICKIRKIFCFRRRIPSQAYIIEKLIKSCKYKSYLELGLYFGATYCYIKNFISDADGVDMEYKNFIDKSHFFCMSTDEFFERNRDKRYDIIFIDASHEFVQVKKDFDNSIALLNENGVILLHDTDPHNKEYMAPNRCNDCYKMNEYLSTLENLNFVTIPLDETGLTIVKRKADLRYLRYV
ncbi:hypothetical protein AGMMS50268_12780 [Spirochaetia bacterium]|nr:hypothetical protein AGMMS50268_12780 [Spirochaetia bacterium]